jgi:hypothetical protein
MISRSFDYGLIVKSSDRIKHSLIKKKPNRFNDMNIVDLYLVIYVDTSSRGALRINLAGAYIIYARSCMASYQLAVLTNATI